ncbi:MAG: aminoacyl-tRNA hydrolase [Candidatus Competibacterales bacterium]
MDTAPQLVVGLGNPGPQYRDTRHNAGFWWLDALAQRGGGAFRSDGKFAGEVCRLRLEGQELWLLKPMTYMNRSGQAIGRLATFYKIPRGAILVVHDELDLLPGAIRLKRGGGHGGHNGLRDTIQHLGGNDFWRLRIGIGHPGQREEVVNFVLHRPSRDEQTLIDAAMAEALEAFPLLLQGQWQKAMNRLHRARDKDAS